ncbi:DUF6520 family protein [Chryseobacterium salivictor]|uniref:Uncharacterized protein n=1 Tax=Chryseobacterium salivictor TaxID=2547600 RepID=A0A4P6ZIB3_9FLAO|nr:DUF6520 family protein [Chryseobacterium salivictor]QBO59606.1 hypothetical protein NBC122_02805 [Chryseobacterium salivictor]
MKNLKALLLPAVMVLAGAGSAYASHVTKDDAKSVQPGYAYHFGEEEECINVGKTCDTTGTIICTADVGMGSEPLYQLNGTSCPDKLFERVQQ